MKKISFIIRTFNEEKFIGTLLETINSQQNPQKHKIEIVVVDNDSTDDTPGIARKYNTKLINLPKAEFNWGYALNLGIENSTGDLIIIMSAHAIPSDDSWLDKMITPFTDKQIAGVYSRQISWPDAPWFEVYRLNKTFMPQPLRFTNNSSLEDMHFSNAASCIRRDIWEKHNFKILPAAEDLEWAKWSINNGYAIFYAGNALIYHSHNESARYAASKQIEIEINLDSVYNRRRNYFYTILQAIKFIIINSTQIIKLDIGRKKLFRNLSESVLRSIWFIIDFKKVQKRIIKTAKQHEI